MWRCGTGQAQDRVVGGARARKQQQVGMEDQWRMCWLQLWVERGQNATTTAENTSKRFGLKSRLNIVTIPRMWVTIRRPDRKHLAGNMF